MNKCLYKGQEIFASDVAENYAIEEEIRLAGQNKELFCADVDCGQAVFYCRGSNRVAHFKHYETSASCAYGQFYKAKKISLDFINARRDIYDALCKNYSSVGLETKISLKHWCDITLTIDNVVIPIELVDSYMTPRRYHSIRKIYEETSVNEPLYIIISDRDFCEDELETNAIERSQLYENYNTLIRYNPTLKEIVIYYHLNKDKKSILISKSYPLHLFRPEKLKEIKAVLKEQAKGEIVSKTVTIEPMVQRFFDLHPTIYPITKESCSKFFYMYFTSKGTAIRKKIFAANVIKAGWYCDEVSAEIIRGYVQYQKINKVDFYQMIKTAFNFIIEEGE